MATQIDGAICLHIPKTGGTFVKNYFIETKLDHGVEALDREAHIHGVALRKIIGYTEDLIFCFVRHPLTWYRSYWIHKNKLFLEREDSYIDEIVDLPFHEFIKDILQNHPGYLSGFFRGYTERCRFVGKMENLRKDLDCVLNYLRIPYNREYIYRKPVDNINPQSNQKYTIELALAIMESEKEIIEKYNYNYIPLEIIK